MIILRSDLLSHKLSTRDGELVMSMSFMIEDLSGVRGALNMGAEKTHPRTPVVRNLVTWAWNRLVELKSQQDEGKLLEWEETVPRGWQLAASRRLSREAVKCAIRGIGFKMPGLENDDEIYTCLMAGSDTAQQISLKRWDHSIYYNPEPDCYLKDRFKTNVNHFCLCEGADFFDNKFFGISNLEAKVMEPVQKNTMEDTYKALNQAGYTSKGEKTKTKLMQKYIGVYTGSTGGEFSFVPHEQAGGMAGSEGSPAIVANRISFVLGLMGSSYAMQVEAASSLLAIYEGAFDVMPNEFKKNKPLVDAAACAGVYTLLAPFWWGLYNTHMNPVGRCLSFDDAAEGHIRSEASCTLVFKRHGERVDGQFVYDDSYETFGFLEGWALCNQPRSAALNAPSAQSVQMVLLDALRQAGTAGSDVDAVSCHCEGLVMHDAVEVNAISKVLRGDSYGGSEALNLINSACRFGQAQEAHGMMSVLSMLACQRSGCGCPNIHLKTMNPYFDTDDAAVNILTETLPLRTRLTHAGVVAHGFCGVNAYVQFSNEIDNDLMPRATLLFEHKLLSFWPGGGGQIGYSAEPMRGYSILGSWSSWEELEPMKSEGSGFYSFIVTLGENRFEQFQILLDGDRSRTLHPGCAKASFGAAVLGPDVFSDAEGYSWLLDGRPRATETLQLTDGASEVDTRYTGLPGDQYKVQLQIAGKWRAVTWEKLGSKVPSTLGKYFVCASTNEWSLEEMTLEDASTGTFSFELCLNFARDAQFQILRNRDTDQLLYPASMNYGKSTTCSDGDVLGPDESGGGLCWLISGTWGDVIRIELKRSIEQGRDTKQVSWKKVGSRTPQEERERKEAELAKKAAERRAREEREAEELEALLAAQG
jgi:3-oxoacyl-(acyl-carrier-protein) synthase